MGPPSGVQGNNNNSGEYKVYNPELNVSLGSSPGLFGRYRDPMLAKPRPMNRFMELTEDQLEKKEKEQDDLARALKDQMEERKRQKEEERRKKDLEEAYFDEKVERDRQELLM